MPITRLGEYISQFVLIFNADNDLAGEMGGLVLLETCFPLLGIGINFGILQLSFR